VNRLALALLLILPLAAQEARMTDAQVLDLARSAQASSDPAFLAKAIRAFEAHHFPSSKAPGREEVLFAKAMAEDRLGQTGKAAVTLRNLERTFPQSPHLQQGQVILATEAVDRRRFKEADSRLKQAMDSDLPSDWKRRAQELQLWSLAEQGKAEAGLPVLKELAPLGLQKPSQRGLAAIVMTLCAAGNQEQAKGARKDFMDLYPGGELAPRVDLAWARLLGTRDDPKPAMIVFKDIVQKYPESKEADEARLALATLLSEGRLKGHGSDVPSAEQLLGDLHRPESKAAGTRVGLVVHMRLALKDERWKDALESADEWKPKEASESDNRTVESLKAEALRGYARQCVAQGTPGPLLGRLDAPAIQALEPNVRHDLVKLLAAKGLALAARTVTDLAPEKERASLRQAILEGIPSGSGPEDTLAVLPAKGETPAQSLRRARAQVQLGHWGEARAAVEKATPGPERIEILLACLHRPRQGGDPPLLKEAQGCLARAREKGAAREPLAILVADLEVQAGAWKEALALYPAAPLPADRGWVALMRATCQSSLGHKEAARATLKEAQGEPAFKAERDALAGRLAPE
jgi:TolA-binding protein